MKLVLLVPSSKLYPAMEWAKQNDKGVEVLRYDVNRSSFLEAVEHLSTLRDERERPEKLLAVVVSESLADLGTQVSLQVIPSLGVLLGSRFNLSRREES